MNQAALVLFACLLVIYGATSLLCILRLIQLRKFSNEWRHSQVFYMSVSLQAVLRTCCFGLLCVDSGTQDLTVYFLLSLPDSIFIISYILLSWQIVTVYYYSHQTKSVMVTFEGSLVKQKRNFLPGLTVGFFVGIWVVIQGVFYGLLFFYIISKKIVSLEIGIVDCVIPLSMIITMIVLQFSYSGVPLKSMG